MSLILDLEKSKFILQERNNTTGQWMPIEGETHVEGKTNAAKKLKVIQEEAISQGEVSRHFRVRAHVEVDSYNEGWKNALAYLRGEVEKYDDNKVPHGKPGKAG